MAIQKMDFLAPRTEWNDASPDVVQAETAGQAVAVQVVPPLDGAEPVDEQGNHVDAFPIDALSLGASTSLVSKIALYQEQANKQVLETLDGDPHRQFASTDKTDSPVLMDKSMMAENGIMPVFAHNVTVWEPDPSSETSFGGVLKLTNDDGQIVTWRTRKDEGGESVLRQLITALGKSIFSKSDISKSEDV
ncbi:MAG: hypothetical protein P8176_00850 [Gammaproteobacteria bacterium]